MGQTWGGGRSITVVVVCSVGWCALQACKPVRARCQGGNGQPGPSCSGQQENVGTGWVEQVPHSGTQGTYARARCKQHVIGQWIRMTAGAGALEMSAVGITLRRARASRLTRWSGEQMGRGALGGRRRSKTGVHRAAGRHVVSLDLVHLPAFHCSAWRRPHASRKPQAASQGSGGASFPCKSFLPPSAGIIVVPAGKCICTSLLDCEPSQFSTYVLQAAAYEMHPHVRFTCTDLYSIMCLALYIT